MMTTRVGKVTGKAGIAGQCMRIGRAISLCQYFKVPTPPPGNSISCLSSRTAHAGTKRCTMTLNAATFTVGKTTRKQAQCRRVGTQLCALCCGAPCYGARARWRKNGADLSALARTGLGIVLRWGGGGERNVWTLRCLCKDTQNAITYFQFWEANT